MNYRKSVRNYHHRSRFHTIWSSTWTIWSCTVAIWSWKVSFVSLSESIKQNLKWARHLKIVHPPFFKPSMELTRFSLFVFRHFRWCRISNPNNIRLWECLFDKWKIGIQSRISAKSEYWRATKFVRLPSNLHSLLEPVRWDGRGERICCTH